MSGASHYIECVTPIGTHRRPPAYTHTAKKVSQPSAMLRNSQVAKSRRKIEEITCFIVLFQFCMLSLASLLSSVATQWCASADTALAQTVAITDLQIVYKRPCCLTVSLPVPNNLQSCLPVLTLALFCQC